MSAKLVDRSRVGLVHNLYNILLAREPDPAGLEGMLWHMENGATCEDLAKRIVQSAEFQDRVTTYVKPPKPLPNLIALCHSEICALGRFLKSSREQKGTISIG